LRNYSRYLYIKTHLTILVKKKKIPFNNKGPFDSTDGRI